MSAGIQDADFVCQHLVVKSQNGFSILLLTTQQSAVIGAQQPRRYPPMTHSGNKYMNMVATEAIPQGGKSSSNPDRA